MEQAKILNFKKALSDSNNILIVLPEAVNTDTISAATTLFHFISSSLRKNVLLATSNKIPVRFSHILSAYGIEEKYILSDIKPLQYIITLQDVEKDLELAVNRKESDIEIVMVPKVSEIDLSKVKLDTVGTKFDLFVVINSKSLEDIGYIYMNTKNVFSKGKITSITSNFSTPYASETLNDMKNSTVSESVYEILEGFGASLDQLSKDVLFEGIVEGTDGLHKLISKKAVQTALDLTSDQNFTEKFQNLFYGYSPEGLELRKRIFTNLVQNGNVVYSTLSSEDLEELGIKGQQLDGIDFLPFDIVDSADTYILSYNYNGGSKILIETENLDDVFNNLNKAGFKTSRTSHLLNIVTEKAIQDVINAISGQTSIFETSNPVVQEKSTEQKVDSTEDTPFSKAGESYKANTDNTSPFQRAK